MIFVVRFDDKVHMVISLDKATIKSNFDSGKKEYWIQTAVDGIYMVYEYKDREVWEYILEKMWHAMATKLWPESLIKNTTSKQIVAPNEAE